MMVAKKETLAEQVEKSWHVLFASLWPYITFPVWKQVINCSDLFITRRSLKAFFLGARMSTQANTRDRRFF